MNLDYPERGPLFAYTMEAAIKRTVHEYEVTATQISDELNLHALSLFTGSGANKED
jgi:hypothetical protein